MTEIFIWWNHKKNYTFAQIKKLKKQIKKSYKKAEAIKIKYEKIHKEEEEAAEKLFDNL